MPLGIPTLSHQAQNCNHFLTGFSTGLPSSCRKTVGDKHFFLVYRQFLCQSDGPVLFRFCVSLPRSFTHRKHHWKNRVPFPFRQPAHQFQNPSHKQFLLAFMQVRPPPKHPLLFRNCSFVCFSCLICRFLCSFRLLCRFCFRDRPVPLRRRRHRIAGYPW